MMSSARDLGEDTGQPILTGIANVGPMDAHGFSGCPQRASLLGCLGEASNPDVGISTTLAARIEQLDDPTQAHIAHRFLANSTSVANERNSGPRKPDPTDLEGSDDTPGTA